MKIFQGGIASDGSSRGEILIKVTPAINDGGLIYELWSFQAFATSFLNETLANTKAAIIRFLRGFLSPLKEYIHLRRQRTKQPQPTSRPIILLQSGLYQRLCKFQARTNSKMYFSPWNNYCVCMYYQLGFCVTQCYICVMLRIKWIPISILVNIKKV